MTNHNESKYLFFRGREEDKSEYNREDNQKDDSAIMDYKTDGGSIFIDTPTYF